MPRISMLLSGIILAVPARASAQQSPAPVAHQDTAATAITPALIARGDSIFHGQAAGGTCFACHGAEGKGNPGLAPDLTSGTWLHGDGSYGFIIQTIEAGVAKPKVASAPMPPKGGAQLTPLDVRAVAAYVYSLNHPHKP